MVILISPESDISNEIEILNELFQKGLRYFHLRKPQKNAEEHTDYLNQIDKAYHDRIVIHFFHHLMEEFNLRGCHFQEKQRKSILKRDPLFLKKNRKKNRILTSAFHTLNELEHCPFEFDYHLLSPVFSSLSKKNYEGKKFDVNHIKKKTIGLGGATLENVEKFKKMGYDGIAFLGTVWNDPSPISAFENLKHRFETVKLNLLG